MLSPAKPFDEIKPNLVCELLTWIGRATSKIFLAPPPGALGRGQKVKYHLISITKSISKIFIPNFVCVLTNESYKTYQMGFFLFCRLGHALGVGLGGTWGPKSNSVLLSYPLCYLLLNHWTKLNQIWCVSYSHEWGVQRKKKNLPRPLGPLGGVKRSNII